MPQAHVQQREHGAGSTTPHGGQSSGLGFFNLRHTLLLQNLKQKQKMKKRRGIVWRSSAMGSADRSPRNCSACTKISSSGNLPFPATAITLWIDSPTWIHASGITGLDRFNVVSGRYPHLVFCIPSFRSRWVLGNRWRSVALKCWTSDALRHCDSLCRKVFTSDWFGMDFVRRDLFVGT